MLLTRKRKATAHDERIRELLAQRHDVARMNQNRLDQEARIAGYEQKYGMRSDQVHGAIDRDELKETQEVCSWLIAYGSLERTKGR